MLLVMLDVFTANAPLHFGAEGVTQSDDRVFMWDIKQMVLNDSALHPGQLGLSSHPDSREYSNTMLPKRDGNINFIFTYCSIFLKLIMQDKWGRM